MDHSDHDVIELPALGTHRIPKRSASRSPERNFNMIDLEEDDNDDDKVRVLKEIKNTDMPLPPIEKFHRGAPTGADPFLDASNSPSVMKKLRISSPFNKEKVTSLEPTRKNIIKRPSAPVIKPPVKKIRVEPSSEEDIPPEIIEEMEKIQENFEGLETKYRLIDKIGEGTFSTVYKAESLLGDARYLAGDSVYRSPGLKRHKAEKKQSKFYVALKRIHVTSSPTRILNELKLLYILSGSQHVAPILEALRREDQIIAVLPYYQHADFRDFFRDLPLEGIKTYMNELFEALKFVHNKKIIHRDVKPTNFLFDPFKKKGVLVDFGLAEQDRSGKFDDYEQYDLSLTNSNVIDQAIIDQLDERYDQPKYIPTDPDDPNFCPCKTGTRIKAVKIPKGYPKNDKRGSRRANRAGTRGFRAPEVLFKCPFQTTRIDIWSAGVILLTLLSRRFPFFNSRDDIDALVELTTIFGLKEMKQTAKLHGLGLDTNIGSLQVKKQPLTQLIYKTILLEAEKGTLPHDSVSYDTLSVFNKDGDIVILEDDSLEMRIRKREYINAFEVMENCFKLDPKERPSAVEILQLPFFTEDLEKNLEDDEDDIYGLVEISRG